MEHTSWQSEPRFFFLGCCDIPLFVAASSPYDIYRSFIDVYDIHVYIGRRHLTCT